MVLETIVKKLSEREGIDARLVSVDWLIGRLFQLRAQIASGEWPPKLDMDED